MGKRWESGLAGTSDDSQLQHWKLFRLTLRVIQIRSQCSQSSTRCLALHTLATIRNCAIPLAAQPAAQGLRCRLQLELPLKLEALESVVACSHTHTHSLNGPCSR
eukprot:20024-Amphidinium_carterae.1